MTDAHFASVLSLARDNDSKGVEAMLRMGCPPTFANGVGQTALHIGAMWGSVDCVRMLLMAKANPNQQNKLRGSAPLHAAALGRAPADRRAECATLLIQFKGDPKRPDNSGESPLEAATDEELRLALGGAPLVLQNAVRARSITDLKGAMEQVIRGKVEHLTMNSSDGTGDTALHVAVQTGWHEGLQMLVAFKADPSMPNATGSAPLHTAVRGGNHNILQVLLCAKADVAATDRDLDADPRFASVTFNETPEKHRTALHYAAEVGNVIVIEALLNAKANVNAKDSKNQSPLHLCIALREEPDIDVGYGVRVEGLLKKPEWNECLGSVIGELADLDGDENNMFYPVLLQNSTKGVIIKPSNLQALGDLALDNLLQARADVNAGNFVTGETMTMLHLAAKSGDAVLAHKVLSARADLDKVDSKLGFSALHLAARGKRVDLVKLLVEAKAQVDQRTLAGKTAEELAKANRAPEQIISLLSGA